MEKIKNALKVEGGRNCVNLNFSWMNCVQSKLPSVVLNLPVINPSIIGMIAAEKRNEESIMLVPVVFFRIAGIKTADDDTKKAAENAAGSAIKQGMFFNALTAFSIKSNFSLYK